MQQGPWEPWLSLSSGTRFPLGTRWGQGAAKASSSQAWRSLGCGWGQKSSAFRGDNRLRGLRPVLDACHGHCGLRPLHQPCDTERGRHLSEPASCLQSGRPPLHPQGDVRELARRGVSTQTPQAPRTVAPTYLRRRVVPGPRRGGEVSASLGVRRPPAPPPRAGAATRPGHGPRRPSGRHGTTS